MNAAKTNKSKARPKIQTAGPNTKVRQKTAHSPFQSFFETPDITKLMTSLTPTSDL